MDSFEQIGEMIGRMGVEVRNRFLTERVILDVLIENNLITKEEFNRRYEEMYSKYNDDFNKYLETGQMFENKK